MSLLSFAWALFRSIIFGPFLRILLFPLGSRFSATVFLQEFQGRVVSRGVFQLLDSLCALGLLVLELGAQALDANLEYRRGDGAN